MSAEALTISPAPTAAGPATGSANGGAFPPEQRLLRILDAAAIVTLDLAELNRAVVSALASDIATTSNAVTTRLYAVLTPYSRRSQHERNLAAAALIDQWLQDDSGYDEQVWPVLEAELRENPLRFREP
jgi:hypothetical protein